MADLGEGLAPPPYFGLKKKEEMTEGKMAGMASKSRQPLPPPPLSPLSLAQGLDPPLVVASGWSNESLKSLRLCFMPAV